MAKKVFDVVAVTGKYTDRNGNEKSRYQPCGAVFENDRGNLSLKLEALPVGSEWSGWLQLYEPKEPNQAQQRHQQQKANGYQDDQADVPF
jgi:hypothetical protein